MKRLLSVLAFTVAAVAQTAAPMPSPEVQYLDNTGAPLANGKLCSYIANTSTPLVTYVDSIGTPNTNPVTLDSAGRASLWGAANGVLYKLVLRSGGTAYPASDACTTGAILWSQDNIPLPGTGGQAVLNSLYVIQTGSGSSGTGGYIDLPLITYPNTTCLDIYGNVVNQPKPTPGSAAFQNADAILWNSPSPLAGVSPPGCATILPQQAISGLNLNTYLFAMGGLATSNIQYNSIQSLNGGAYVKLGYTADQALYLLNHATSPSLNNPSAGYGAFAHKAGSVFWYYNDITTTWSSVDLSSIGGAAAGPAMAIQFNSSPAGTFTGVANLEYNLTTQAVINIGKTGTAGIVNLTSYVQSDQGFVGVNNATPSTPLPYNTFQVPTGGMQALTFSAVNFIQSGICCGTVGSPTAGPPPLTTGMAGFKRGDMYWDLATAAELVYNGTAFVGLGGGGGASVGAAGQVQISGGGGAFAASANFTFSSQLMTVVSVNSGSPGVIVYPGWLQADGGLLAVNHTAPATALAWNIVQAPTGGMAAMSFTAGNGGTGGYVQTGHGAYAAGVGPTATTGGTVTIAGTITYSDTLNCEIVYSGGSWACMTGGGSGVSSINAGSGALTGAIVLQGTTNEVILNPVGNTITFSTPQPLDTGANVIFANIQGNVHTGSEFKSTVSGGLNGFDLSNGNFTVDGNGNLRVKNSLVVTTGAGAGSIQTTGGITALLGSTFSGGITTGASSNSAITIGSAGNFYTRFFSGGAPSCAGVADGWLALNTSNQQLYVCIGGTEYHTGPLTTP